MKLQFSDGWEYSYNDNLHYAPVIVPHDAMIECARSASARSGGACAYFEGGKYFYKKEFDVPSEWMAKEIFLEFEGVYRKAKVYINGIFAYEWANGYTGFHFSCNDFLKFGGSNVIEVVADNSEQPNSRWYTGGGIYRPVWLHVKNKAHLELFGTHVETVGIDPPTVNLSAKHTGGELNFTVKDGEKVIATRAGEGELVLPAAKLWSAEEPNLYTLYVTLSQNGEIVDEESIPFGIRKLEWSSNGFFVNGNNTLFRGGCVHHDNGILGACAFAEAEERKVRKIKEAGFNAVRFSHNPCSNAFAAACDQYGLYLIDEFSDMWYMRKKKFDYALDFEAWHERDLRSMVEKDFNHPSIVMYSIGNEVSEPCEEKGVETARSMVSLLHSLDSTRAVTAGINLFIINNAKKGKGQYSEEKVEADAAPKQQAEKPTSSTLFNMIATHVGPSMNKMANSAEVDAVASPVLDLLDIAGYNYASGRYPLEGKKHPKRIIFGSETFPQDIYKNWEAVKKYPYLLGDFMWTAWDYLGEVGIGGWCYETQYGLTFEKPYPWIIADAGAIDLIGTVGVEAKYASTVWGLEEKPFIGVRPVNQNSKKLVKSVWRGTNAIASWAWKDCEGQTAEIEVYSSACFVELYLNGKKIGRKKVKECKAFFKTKYCAGSLLAVALNNKKEIVGKSELQSAQSELSVGISCEKQSAKAGEVLFFEVCLCDKSGTVESNADTYLTARVEGGTLLAFGSAQQKSEEKYSSEKVKTYYGRALLAVKCKESGKVNVRIDGQHVVGTDVSVNINQ